MVQNTVHTFHSPENIIGGRLKTDSKINVIYMRYYSFTENMNIILKVLEADSEMELRAIRLCQIHFKSYTLQSSFWR